MGAGNVGLAFARWGSLHHAPFRALVYMAHRSLDSGNPPRFWGGREDLAAALGRPIPEPYGEEFEKMRKADFEMVKKVIGALTKAGAITLSQASGPNQNAVYTLNLRTVIDSPPPGDGGNSVPPSGGNSVPRMGGTQVANGGNSVPPLGEGGGTGLSTGVDGQGDQQPAGVAQAREGEDDHHHFREFNGPRAFAYLRTLAPTDDLRLSKVARAQLGPKATAEQVAIRAAEIAVNGAHA